MFESPNLGRLSRSRRRQAGASLPWIYLLWVAVVVTLYPVCAWFAAVEAAAVASVVELSVIV